MAAKHTSTYSLLFSALLAVMMMSGVPVQAEILISEFLASNSSTLADDDGAFSDWIELHNSDAAPVDLTGWYLTDSAANKMKWQFPAVSIPAGGYLLVFASNKNRADPARALHTNFALSADGEYLGLTRPDGASVVFEYSPAYPAQTAGISYGVAAGIGQTSAAGYFQTPTPGAANGATGAARLTETAQFSRRSGPFTSSFSLELSGSGSDQQIRYEFAPPSSVGAVVREPSSESPLYSEPLLIDRPLLIRAAVFSQDGKARGPATSVHYFQLDLSSPLGLGTFSSLLPVLVLEQHGYGGLTKADGEQPAWVYGYAPRARAPTFADQPDFVIPAITAIRGSSSADFPKKSYNLDLLDPIGKKSALSLFGSGSFDEWALVGPWLYDPSLIRNSYVYALSNSIGRWAPRTIPVEVFLNTDGSALDSSAYVGVYALTDKVKIAPGRVDIAELKADAANEPDITGGYLLKIDVPDENEFSWRTDHGLDIDTFSSVVVSSPKIDKLTAPQRAYIRDYVQKMENALHADRERGWKTRSYLDYIDRPSWVDHHILNTFSANPDAFERSAYFSKNRGGKLVAGPVWDFDRALGSNEDLRSGWDAWRGENATQPWHFGWWGILATDPEFMQDWVDRWQSLRRNEFAGRNLTALADTLANAIGPEAAARDAAQWVDNVSALDGTHAGEITHLKTWLLRRAQWIDSQFVAPPEASANGATIALVPVSGAQIAYTLDGSDPRALGGDIAPNTILSSGPVAVPAASNLHARSYHEEMKDAFPGSPWSSAVGGPASSPLSPGSRLSNISTRALVGFGENALVTRVVVADTQTKSYLARAIGPALAALGSEGTVADPQLSILSADGAEWLRNNGWENGPDPAQVAQFTRRVGAFPLAAGSLDSAVSVELSAGPFTVEVSTPNNQPGVGLAELYELDTNGRTANLSTRAFVGVGDHVLVSGLVVQGVAHKRMLIRAVGPTLAELGISNALVDPVLTIFSGDTVVATNDQWSGVQGSANVAAATARVGAFNLGSDSEDAALLITLAPGSYTLDVRGKAGAEGIVLLEIYEVP